MSSHIKKHVDKPLGEDEKHGTIQPNILKKMKNETKNRRKKTMIGTGPLDIIEEVLVYY